MSKRLLLLLGAGGAIFAFVACGSDDSSTSSDGGVDARAADGGSDVNVRLDSSTDGPIDSASDTSASDTSTSDTGIADSSMDVGEASPFPINGCQLASFVDQTAAAATRTIDGPSGVAPPPGPWTPPCMRIKAGQSVTWNATFSSHPLEPAGGDSSTPIAITSSGTTVTFLFPNAGLFGYDCQFHASMRGAILVDP